MMKVHRDDGCVCCGAAVWVSVVRLPGTVGPRLFACCALVQHRTARARLCDFAARCRGTTEGERCFVVVLVYFCVSVLRRWSIASRALADALWVVQPARPSALSVFFSFFSLAGRVR